MRGKQAPKRVIAPDPKYHNTIVAKFINYVMYGGKKTIAQKIVYDALETAQEKSGMPALDIFDTALKNVMPIMEVKGRRIGGANYQVPIPVRGERKYSLTFRWIIGAARHKKGRSMASKLAEEFVAAVNKEGDAMKKRNDVHRMAEANRAFAHFARFGGKRRT